MKLLKNIAIILAILAVLVLPKLFCNNKENPPTGKGNTQKMPVSVSTLMLRPEPIHENYQVNGTLLPNEQIDLKTETQGIITHVYFKEGSIVNKGQLLLKLNDTDFQTQLKKALATKKLKEDNAERNKVLLKKEAISQADYDLSETELSAIEADIAYLKEQIRKTELRAPFQGTIGLRQVSEGAFITQNTSIARLQDVSQLKLEFSVPEKYASKINLGDKVDFFVSNHETKHQAKVYARETGLSNETRSIVMRAICENKGQQLIPGSFANVALKIASPAQSFLIPTQAVIPVLKGQKVFKVLGDTAVEVMIKTGFRKEDKIEVTQGLQAGDEVVIEGIMYVKPGAKLKVSRK